MSLKSKLWHAKVSFWSWWLRTRYGMHIGKNCAISPHTHIDRIINPHGIHIGDNVTILKGAVILSHDACRSLTTDTYIGDNCVIGVFAMIMPGVHIGPHTVVGAGAVVTKDTPGHCIVAGNPAKVIKVGVELNDEYQIINFGHRVDK